MTEMSTRLFIALAALSLASGWPVAAYSHEKGDEKKPEPPVAMKVIAPSAKGPWLLRIDNEGDEPLRIAGDVRLLSFEVSAPLPNEKVRRGRSFARSVDCQGPPAFALSGHFPIDRELVLEPGQSYVEQFDPRLICFGKKAELLVPGARVKPRFGWKPKPKWRRGMETAPFVADAAKFPRKYRPLKRLEAPTVMLSHGPPAVYGPDPIEKRAEQAGKPSGSNPAASGATKETGAKEAGTKQAGSKEAGTKEGSAQGAGAGKPKSAEEASKFRDKPRVPRPQRKPPPSDDLAARLSLTTSHYADAVRPTDISLSVQAHNVGQRPLFIALRGRMLSFIIEGPDGVVECARATGEHKVPRDLFRLMHHGTHVHMNVMLAEVCPPGTFDRPGLYRAFPTLHADAAGREYGLSAATGTVTTRSPGKVSGTHDERDDYTLIRVREGRRPFYRGGANAMPTRVLPE